MAIENQDRDTSVRLEPERHGDLGEPARRLPEALAMRCREWSRALWAPVYFRLGLGIFTLGAIAMIGARAQGEPRGTVVATLRVPDSETRSAPPAGPVPCASASSPVRPPDAPPAPSPTSQAALPTTSIAEAPSRGTDAGRVVLNTATEAEFDRLPGVGPKRAQEIVKLRERLGRFRRVSDLLRVRGVGPKTLKKWQDLVVLDPPPAEPKVPAEQPKATVEEPQAPAAGNTPAQGASERSQPKAAPRAP